MATETLVPQNKFSTTLTTGIVASDTVIPLNSLPTAAEGYLTLDEGLATEEVIYYISKGANFVTCPSAALGRGLEGTSASSHSSNAVVKQKVNVGYYTKLQQGENNVGLHTWAKDYQYPYVQSGLVWTGDSLGSTRNGSMTAGIVYINGKRLTVALVTAKLFNASSDTYIDVLDNLDYTNTGTVVYTPVSNNSASPALAANSIRIGIVVTGATTIANAGSINQGQPDKVLPIASSIAYTTTDSLGNLIYNTSPTPSGIGYRATLTSPTTTSTAAVAITGLSMPIIVPAGRKVVISLVSPELTNIAGGAFANSFIYDGSTAGAIIAAGQIDNANATTLGAPINVEGLVQPSLTAASSKTYVGAYSTGNAARTAQIVTPYIKATLV